MNLKNWKNSIIQREHPPRNLSLTVNEVWYNLNLTSGDCYSRARSDTIKSTKTEALKMKVMGYTGTNIPGTGKHTANITPKTILFRVRKNNSWMSPKCRKIVTWSWNQWSKLSVTHYPMEMNEQKVRTMACIWLWLQTFLWMISGFVLSVWLFTWW